VAEGQIYSDRAREALPFERGRAAHRVEYPGAWFGSFPRVCAVFPLLGLPYDRDMGNRFNDVEFDQKKLHFFEILQILFDIPQNIVYHVFTERDFC
jgi:hypothetical protein